MSLVLGIRWRTCNFFSFTVPYSSPVVKRNTCYKATLHLTASKSKTAKNSMDVIQAKNLGVYGCRLAYQPVAFFELVLFSIKLQVCFLQQPELCTVQERGTIKKKKKKKPCIKARFLPWTTENCSASLLLYSRHSQTAGPHYRQRSFSH